MAGSYLGLYSVCSARVFIVAGRHLDKHMVIVLLRYSGTPVMRPQLLPHKNGHTRGVVVCQGHELF